MHFRLGPTPNAAKLYHLRRQERTRSGSSFVTVRRERAGPVHCSVTGMLVMAGMPALLAGAIIAHECMHAYLRLTGVRSRQLTMHDEEGLCELMAVLYLKHEQSKVGRQPYALQVPPWGPQLATGGAARGQHYGHPEATLRAQLVQATRYPSAAMHAGIHQQP